MATDIWAILDDYSSTPECPNMTNVLTINKAGGLSHDAVRPMFITLTNEEFLDRCKEGSIQRIGLEPPCKGKVPCSTETLLAIDIAVCLYNSGAHVQ